MSWLPRSLFARLMLIWLFGITLVLAVSFVLFVGERDRIGRTALFESVAQEIASAANVLDRLAPEEREPWFEQLSRRRLHLSDEQLGQNILHKGWNCAGIKPQNPAGIELPQIVRTAQKSPYVGNI